jgi:putative addiction module component (TIGR02574 family)
MTPIDICQFVRKNAVKDQRGVAMEKSAMLESMDSWTIEERLEFIDDVYDRLDANVKHLDPDPGQWAEIERRLAAHEADPTNVVTWEQAEARLKARK